MKSLIIAEKPSVGRDIAKVLKCNKRGNGFLYNDKYIISWAVGHLVTLQEPDEYDARLKSWNVQSLPILPRELKLKAIPNTREQLKILHSLINQADVTELICATDSGREGELIFRYIYEITRCNKPFKRLWISSLTDDAIKDGFANLKDGSHYDNLYYSAKCRSEADWLVGMNATRAFTLKYNVLLSVGRVQTPTLAILVDRHNEIVNFKSEDYFEIEVLFEVLDEQSESVKENQESATTYKALYINNNLKEDSKEEAGDVTEKPKEKSKANEKEKDDTKKLSRILDKKVAEKIVKDIKGKNGVVKSINDETKKQPAPFLYDLTELQRECNKKYSFSAKKTLSIAQDLYEKRKMITYPRTDSRHLSSDMVKKLKHILSNLNKVNEYKGFTDYVLGLDKLPISKRIVDNSKITDHHAIIPNGSNINLQALSDEEFKVYNLIARRFIAVFYPNYVYNTTKIITEISTPDDKHEFLTKGTTISQKGWTELNVITDKEKSKSKSKSTSKSKSSKDDSATQDILPSVVVGQEVLNKNEKLLSKKTKPPTYYNEATLLSAMENAGRFVEDEDLKEQLKESGLGTPATRASIIERLLQVKYITRKGKSLIPTEKGVNLIAVLPKELISPETTGKWERGLTSISKGAMQKEKFMGSISRYVNFLVDYSKNTPNTIVFEKEASKNNKPNKNLKSFGKCLKCGGDIFENTKGFYCSNWNSGCESTIWKNTFKDYDLMLTQEMITALFKDKSISNVLVKDPATGLQKIATLNLNINAQITILIN